MEAEDIKILRPSHLHKILKYYGNYGDKLYIVKSLVEDPVFEICEGIFTYPSHCIEFHKYSPIDYMFVE